MWNEYGPGPIDSYDAYSMGLRPARCNGCKFAKLKHELGNRFLHMVEENGWHTVYELNAKPHPGQKLLEHEGHPVLFHASFMSIGHSDECYHWQSPEAET